MDLIYVVYITILSVSQRQIVGKPGIIPLRTGILWAKNLIWNLPNIKKFKLSITAQFGQS